MNKEYLISVIMPVYKVKSYIKDSVLSVINQTYKNIELILVDDGDPDRSWKIAEELLRKNNYPYEIIHQENAGQGWARNVGLKRAKGDYVYFLDSDDIILRETIERMVSTIQNREDVVFCGYKSVRNPDDITEEYHNDSHEYLSREQVLKDFLTRSKIVLAPGTLYNKCFLRDNGLLFEKISWSEDQHFIWRVLAKCNGVIYLREKLYQYRRNDNSIMHSTPVEKIIASYAEIVNLDSCFEDEQFGKWVVSRWAVGSIGAACRYLEYAQWKILYDKIEGKMNFSRLHNFPHKKTRMVSYLGECMPYMFYRINKARLK